MTDSVVFRSDMTVELVSSMASDSAVVRSARVSTIGGDSGFCGALDMRADEFDTSEEVAAWEQQVKRDKGLINFLARDRHGTPFESSVMTFFIGAPIFVFREFQRHRIASYNEESARYKQLKPEFYVPDVDRAVIQVGKPGAYTFEKDDRLNRMAKNNICFASEEAYLTYQRMLDDGVAREVARMVLPVNIYSSMYVTMNARSLMNFLSLRRNVEGQSYPSFPQREIEMVAEQMEDIWKDLMPVTHEAFVKHGRVSP